MADMLGTKAKRYFGKNWWYCCRGHDGWRFRKPQTLLNKRALRHREKNQIRKELE